MSGEEEKRNQRSEAKDEGAAEGAGSKGQGRALSAVPFALTLRAAAAVLVVASLPAMWLGARYVFSRPERVSLLWQAEGKLAAGAPYAPFLMVRHTTGKDPIEGVKIAAFLEPRGEVNGRLPVGEGATDAAGVLAEGPWRVPDVPAGEYRLVVEARSERGRLLDRAGREIKVVDAARLVLSPDRSQARPGETVRVRTLLVGEAGSKPLADRPVAIDLLDPEGNRIARSETRTSEFGLSWAEFPLDSLAREGGYVLRAEAGGLKAHSTVQVKHYRLPAYRVVVVMDRRWFGARDEITGSVSARTFDGHPVGGAKGEARLVGGDGKLIRRAEVELDEEGTARLRLAPLGPGGVKEKMRMMRLAVRLVDPAGRRAGKKTFVTVSRTPVVVHAVAEAGELVRGVENIVYIVARRPDGAPVQGRLFVVREGERREKRVVETDARGVAILKLKEPRAPAEVLLVSGSADGKEFRAQRVSVPVRPLERNGAGRYGSLLVRTDRAVVSAGDELRATILSAAREGTVTLALRQDGRPVAVAGARIKGGRGDALIHVPPGVSGYFTLDAMLAVEDGRLWTDGRVIAVAGDGNVRVSAAADSAEYRPGDTARLDFRVTDAEGRGLPAAVSVVAVDEALLALTGENPGLAQALRAAGANLPRMPGFPLDAAGFTPEKGREPAAHAALAAVQPPSPQKTRARLDELLRAGLIGKSTAERMRRLVERPEDEYERTLRERVIEDLKAQGIWQDVRAILGLGAPAGASIVDTSPSKIAEHQARRRETAGWLWQWLFGLLAVGAVLGVLLYAWNAAGLEADSTRRALACVPLVTLAVVAVGTLGGVYVLEDGLRALLVVLSATLVTAHVLLLVRANALRRRSPRFGYRTADAVLTTAVTDGLALLFALGVVGRADEPEAYVGAFVLAVGMLFAAGFQYRASHPPEERWAIVEVLLFIFLLVFVAAIAVPSLMGSRISSNEAALTASARTLLGADNMYRRGHPQEDAPEAAEGAETRLRWDFTETLVFAPEIVTDADGRATLHVPVADSLTSWRVQADAIAAEGGTAWTGAKLVVTQPFSVDLTLPADVTAGDVLYVPAVVSNHTSRPREVELTLKLTGARAIDGTVQAVLVPAKSVASAEFCLRFERPGTATIRITALAGDESDAVRRALAVLPDGRPVGFAASSLIHQSGELAVTVPEDAIPGTVRASLRLHRGPLSQLIEGLEGMLREPYGCFEQTSSCTYPNVLVLSYLKTTGAARPEVEERAERFIARGYQRLLGFEVGRKSGSFSLYGRPPASAWLTAYGLLEFSDMSRVYPVDPALLERIRAWLRARVREDGSFAVRGRRGGKLGIAGTAYAVWALGKDAPRASVDFLRSRIADVEKDAYLCALVANALADIDPATAAHLAGRLRRLATVGTGAEGRSTAELSASRTLAWGYGRAATIEATALGVLALLETGEDMELAKMLLATIHEGASPGGGWGSTHATVLALKALVRSASVGKHAGPARVVAEIDGRSVAPIDLPAEETAVPASVPLALEPGASRVRLQVSGGPVAARVSGRAYVPWGDEAEPGGSPLKARVSYSATRVRIGGAVLGRLTVASSGRKAELPMVEWGMPAGFVAEGRDLDALRAGGAISHYEVSGRTLRLYLPDLAPEESATLSVRFYATARGRLRGPAGRAYEYYRNHEAAVLEPVSFEVF